MDRINIFLLIICSLLVAGVIGYKDFLESNKLYFVIDIEASNTGSSQIFFDIGHGYNEHDSTMLQVNRGSFQKYSFPLPASVTRIKAIRFDPINKTSVLGIKKAGIENMQGDTLKTFPVQSFKPIQQISRMEVGDDVLVIHTTENANDPVTLLENSLFDREISRLDFLIKRGWIYVGYALLILVVFLVFVEYASQTIARVVERLVGYAIANPRKSITFIGLFSAIASCYPIVFFGKSFVHPVGMPALYNGAPWFPGFPFDGVIENFRGSDTGATAWCIASNSVVEHDSIFRYVEFPFWNRYVGGGIPLFAQGQSMVGDILHWIPIFLGGGAIGWDIKFVLSKAIFAVGIGLLVFRLTDKLLAGLLIAISSCFLGFFAYRFNHPAFFVLTYAPWIVLQWDRLGRVLVLPNPRISSCVFQSLLLATITWFQLNAGAPKEGVITACFMQALGALAFWRGISPKWGGGRTFVFICGIGFALVMIAAPYWLLFLDVLSKSFTSYDVPGIQTFPLWIIGGFFDNFLFQKQFDYLAAPSVNLFVLFCMSSAFLSLRVRQSIMVYGSWGLFALAMATAYGLVPQSILIGIPFVNKIQHIINTFSVPMMILALIISGYGIRDYLMASKKIKRAILVFSLLNFLTLWLAYVLNGHGWNHTIIFFVATFFIVLIGFIQLNRHAVSGSWTKRGLILLTLCFLALHIRHGMHLMTGLGAIDNNVVNPTLRINFSNKSNAIEFVKNEIDSSLIPTRVIGEDEVLFPGFNSRLGLEGIVPVDAVRNKYYENLLTLVDYPVMQWDWLRLIKSDQIASRAASLDLLGIGYIVAELGTHMPQGMKLVHSSDLDVWQRESVWPRAFFVNKIVEVHKPSDILDALADKSSIPFAAVESQFIPQGSEVMNNNAPYQVVPASGYKLTNNSTRFSVEANGPGIIVLGETYYPGDFIVNVNGEKVDYIRVNEASKGVWISKAGKYDVSFTYRPEKLNQAMFIFIFGLALLLLLIWGFAGTPRNLKNNL